MIEYISLEDALALIQDLSVGPVRDLGLLDSAIYRPQSTLFGSEAYQSIDEKCAALLQSLVHNHPLVDGNKRLGWLATVVFFKIKGITIEGDDDDIYDTVIAVASNKIEFSQLVAKLTSWH